MPTPDEHRLSHSVWRRAGQQITTRKVPAMPLAETARFPISTIDSRDLLRSAYVINVSARICGS